MTKFLLCLFLLNDFSGDDVMNFLLKVFQVTSLAHTFAHARMRATHTASLLATPTYTKIKNIQHL